MINWRKLHGIVFWKKKIWTKVSKYSIVRLQLYTKHIVLNKKQLNMGEKIHQFIRGLLRVYSDI